MNEDNLEKITGICITIFFVAFMIVGMIGLVFCGIWIIQQIIEML